MAAQRSMSMDHEAQRDEMLALESIFDSSEFTSQEISGEFSGKFNAFVALPEGFKIIYRMLPAPYWRYGRKQKHNETQDEAQELAIKFLPPLELSFTLPSDYPSTCPPRFTLTSCWLDRKQLSNLCKRLDSLWEENKGLEILYLWMSFLKEESYYFLNLGPVFDISKQYTRNINRVTSFQRMQQIQRERQTDVSSTTEEKASTSSLKAETKKNESLINQTENKENGSAQSQRLDVKRPDYRRHGRGRGRGRGQWKDSQKIETGVVGNVTVMVQELNVSIPNVPHSSRGSENKYKSDAFPLNSSHGNTENSRNRPKFFRRRETRKTFDLLDQRAVSSVPSDMSLIDFIKEHNSLMSNKEFERNIFTCRICFDDKSGGQCMEFYECGHVFCRECVKGYFEVRIKEGTVLSMTCLEEGCKTEALQKQVQEIVGPELFAKYDALLLSSTLDLMEDIVYCPRKNCQYPVTRDGEDKIGLCPNCQYSFCTLCKMGYHGVEPCRLKSVAKRELVAEYEGASADRKSQLEAKYGRKQLQELVDVTRSEEWISTYSKNCPHCQAAIEKSDGCNRMVCWRCNTNFCWICSLRLDPKIPYLHFNSRASPCFNMLFYGTFEDDEDDEVDNDFFDHFEDEED